MAENKKHQVEDSHNKAAMTLMFRMIVHNLFMRTEMLNRSKL